MMWHYGGFGWIGMIVNLVITLIVIVGFVILVVWAVRRISASHMRSAIENVQGQSARDIAQARYAKGEITRDEYQQIIADLGK